MSAVKIGTLSWRAALKIIVMALEDGTPLGKQMARNELLAIGELLDDAYTGNAPDLSVLKPGVSHWDERPGHPVEDWRTEVINDDTRLGYLAWCEAREADPSIDPAEYRGADYGEDCNG